jgi:class 3 adenylate cyclase/predicted ATPase
MAGAAQASLATPPTVAGSDQALTTYTLLFTDIEGSTHLWETYPDDMEGAVRLHNQLISQAVDSAGGRVLRFMGDGVLAVFGDATQAVAAAVDIQRQIDSRPWPGIGELRVRMGLNTGPCRIDNGELYGRPPNLAARLESASHGGQILVSDATARACAGNLRPGEHLFNLGRFPIRGFDEPVVVHSVVADGLRSAFPPLRTPFRGFDELPEDDSPLVGRDELVDNVASLLQEHTMVTLWGPAGVGKTRIARRVASRARRPYDDGVRFVDLSTTHDQQVARAVGTALRAQPIAGEGDKDTVVRVLRHSRLLIVLDNCEALLPGVQALARAITDQCRAVHVLATSREVLGLPGERAVEVQTLGVPADGEADPARIATADAVRLFVNRARAKVPDFAVDGTNAVAVASLCRGLDGLPLALEVAAARLDVETVAELAATLPLLVERLNDESPFQMTAARAPLCWGLTQFDAAELELFTRLAVFAGSFSRELAIGLAPDRRSAQHCFDRLVRTSMVVRDPATADRFRLLAAARECARSLSTETDHQEHRSMHAHLMLERSESWGPRMRTGDDDACVATLRADFRDHGAAVDFLLDHGRDAEAARMVVALFPFALFQPRPELYRWATALADRIDVAADHAAEVIGIASLGAWYAGDIDDALERGARAVAVAAAHGGSTIPARTALVNAFGYAGDMVDVAMHFVALRDELRASDEPFWQVNGLCYEAISFTMAGRSDKAAARAEAALTLARRLGNTNCIQWALQALGRALAPHDAAAASEAFEAAMEAARSVESRWNIGLALVEWVGLRRRLGDTRNAAAGTLDLLEMIAVSGNRSQLSQALREAALTLADAGRPGVAVAVLVARQGLPQMPQAPYEAAEDEARVDNLRRLMGRGWDRPALRGRSLPEHEVISLCRAELSDVLHAG